MSKSFKVDLTGQRFGRLTVLEFVPNEKDCHSFWSCRCDCGKTVTISGNRLKNGDTKSCGCYNKEMLKKANTVHGGAHTRLYRIWAGMKQRCYYPNTSYYYRYGGRGITICDEWKNDFVVFRDWAMSHGYDDTLSIDRIDNDKGYFPENCRFVNAKTQCRNRRSNTFVEYQGEMITLAEAVERTGIKKGTLEDRYRSGDRGERLFRPVEKK